MTTSSSGILAATRVVDERVPVTILCPTVWGYRNAVISGVLDRLEASGVACHLLLGDFGEDPGASPCSSRMRAAATVRSQRGKAALNSLLRASFARRHGLAASAVLAEWQSRDRTTWQTARDRVVTLLSRIAWRQPFYDWQVRSAERFLERTRDMGPVVEHLRDLRPRLLVSTHSTVAAEMPYILAARRLGIPTVGWILSFDNLTSRSILPVFDHYLVWNGRMRDQVLRLYPDRVPGNIHITGTPQFDFHLDPRFRRGRAECQRDLGLEADDRYVVWAANSRVFTPTEPELVAAFVRRLADTPDLSKHRVVVRLHPLDDYERWQRTAREIPRLVVTEPWSRNATPRADDQTRLVSTLLHADACVNVASTMSLDAAILDVPVVCVAFALDPSSAEHTVSRAYYATEHYRPIVESGGIRLAGSLEELLSLVRNAIRNPHADRDARLRLVRAECGQVDGEAKSRVAAALATLALGRTD